MSLVLDTGTMKYRENPNQPWRPLVIKAGMNWESMADTYDPDNGTYEVGQYVLEEGMMYRCIYEITTPEAWTPAHWTSANVADELASFIIISDDQPTEDSNKIWIAETTSPFGVQIPTIDDHNALGNTLTQLDEDKADKVDLVGNIILNGTNTTGADITAGTYFYNNGTLKRAIATISGNPAGTVTDQNSETVTAGGLNALMNSFNVVSTVVSPSIGTGSVYCFKSGKVVTIFISVNDVTMQPGTAFATIPQEYRPSTYNYDFIDPFSKLRLFISHNGGIIIDSNLSEAIIRGTYTYVI